MNRLSVQAHLESFDSEKNIDQLISEYDTSCMPLPVIETEPHLLISKVRKHYMEYVVKLLSLNFENNQKLLNKNIYLPSAIWRCAKMIENNAAQTCMVTQLYRKNILDVIKELRSDTIKGKLNKKLQQFLLEPPGNEKKVQTSLFVSDDCNCQCTCSKRKKRRKRSESPESHQSPGSQINFESKVKTAQPSLAPVLPIGVDSPNIRTVNMVNTHTNCNGQSENHQDIQEKEQRSEDLHSFSFKSTRMSIESQDSDELTLQLEKLFQADSQDDDLFEGNFYETTHEDCSNKTEAETQPIANQESIKSQIKSLDDRLESLSEFIHNNNSKMISLQDKYVTPKNTKKHFCSKWLCEEYHLKVKFFELLDQIGDSNRRKLARIKQTLVHLFGDDSDEEDGVVSPFEETPDFVTSCKQRFAPWVLKLLNPFYIKGGIKDKALFKALARHLLRLIYQCSRYPSEYEVHSFVSDFLKNHKRIRCEADFIQFRIENME